MTRALMVMSHGKDSSPMAEKIQWLRPLAEAAGWDVVTPDYGDKNAEERVDQLTHLVGNKNPSRCVLSGSSMGGVVSVMAARTLAVDGLFLMVPAVYWPGFEHLDYRVQVPIIEVVHGWHDEVVPLAQVQRWASEHDAPLHILNDSHRLSASRLALEVLFKHFLRRLHAG